MQQKDQLELLRHWARNVKRAQFAHYRMADHYRRQYTAIGVAVTVITVATGSALLADLPSVLPSLTTPIRIVSGLLVLFASALSGLQTFLKLEERKALHAEAGAAYSAVKRHIDQLIADAKDKIIASSVLDDVRSHMDSLGSQSPQISDSVWTAALAEMPALDFKHYYPASHGHD